VASFSAFAETVRMSAGRSLELRYAREGEVRVASIAPERAEYDMGMGIMEERYAVGIEATVHSIPGLVGEDIARNPFVALPRAVSMTVDMTETFLHGLSKIVMGDVSRKQLAGPIGIAQIAGSAWEAGWQTYLSMMVLISINLGILNLLPIPILDGGQAVLFSLEALKGGELSLRTREIAQQIGLAFLLLLMGVAFWNDISRLLAGYGL
jgi:regulator of sigma E protease